MYNVLLGLLVLDGLFLGVVILLQSGKGGGLAAMGGGAAATDVLGGRQATTLLTRATWTAGSAFMVLSLILAIMSSRTEMPSSVLEGLSGPTTTIPEPVLPGVAPLEDAAPPAGDIVPLDDATPPAGDVVPPDPSSDPPPPDANEPTADAGR